MLPLSDAKTGSKCARPRVRWRLKEQALKYFVVWPDGRKFGPADAATLAQWAKEGRISDDTELEEEVSGQRFRFSEIDTPALQWEEPAPVPIEETGTDYEAKVAQASDRPVGDTKFEIPQEFPMGAGSPYPVESYYVKGKSDLNTAYTLIIVGFIVLFLSPCCGLAPPGALALSGTGIYYANKAAKAGQPGADTAKIVGIVVLSLQALALLALVGFWIMMFTSAMTGVRP